MVPTRQRSRSPATVLYTVAGIFSLLAVCSILESKYGPSSGSTTNIQARGLRKRDEECRLVHQAPDQCAFVKANCPDEEAGLISYLQLYYCSLAHVRPVAFTLLTIWATLLFSTIGVASSDFLCVNLSTIAAVLGMSESLAGVTFLAFGNGSPDVFSTFAAMKTNSGSLAVGELMGAACFITAVVAGSMALVKPFKVAKRSFVRDVSFFAVAASFSLVFLYDGSLRLWECVAMVAFYGFYVVFVVVWHWWIQRRRRIKLAEAAARLHQHIPDHQELEAPRIEIDDEDRPASERTSLLRHDSMDSFPSLPQEPPAWKDEDVGDDDEVRNRTMAELQSNMRISRPSRGERRNTAAPIRPSLMGVLEFRSVLNNLERNSTYSRPINLRRYTDDYVDNDEAGDMRRYTTPHPQQAHLDDISAEGSMSSPVGSGRARAVSANAAGRLGINTNLLGVTSNSPETMIYSPESDHHPKPQLPRIVTSQTLLSPGTITPVSGGSSPSSMMATRNGLLAPPNDSLLYPTGQASGDAVSIISQALTIGPPSPGAGGTTSMEQSPKIKAHRSSHSRAPSIHLPPALQSSASVFSLPFPEVDEQQEPTRYRWWPYDHLPAPQTILSTLFPTLYGWRTKSHLDRMLGLLTALPVFLLTITLPIVESQGQDEQPPVDSTFMTPRPPSPEPFRQRSQTSESTGSMAPVSQHPHTGGLARQQSDFAKGTVGLPNEPALSPKEWNRWLVILQLFMAPLFIVAIFCANMEEYGTSVPLKLFLASLTFSLVSLAVLLVTTTSDREPKYRSVLCYLGFAVSIAWISTIANEVVGVLKAVGVILNISDAILGLTIFAMGNSISDLVADITIARLGFPVMALSACFGGPMLNILLGIGMGGMYMTITNAHHKQHKHPHKPLHYKPYELDVNTTLMLSGVALLVTLLGLLIVVPLNNWRMDRKVGVGLITLWFVTTVTNVVLEIIGYGEKWEAILSWLSS